MGNCGKSLSPLVHGGTSQAERELIGLSDDYVRVDENDYAEWIAFTTEFAKHVAFYGPQGAEASRRWDTFFASDVACIVGSFAVQDIEVYRYELGRRLAYLRDDDHAGQSVQLKQHLSEAFSMVLTLARELNRLHQRLPAKNGFRLTLGSAIRSKLGSALGRVFAYLKGAQALGLYSAVGLATPKVLGSPLLDAVAVASDGLSFSPEWFGGAAPDFASVTPDTSVFLGTNDFERVSHAANHFLFTSVFDGFTQTYARLIDDAKRALADALENDDSHTPHLALFFAFLKLFRHARDKLNELTWKHLDYYYREVLGLTPRAPAPDQVYVVAELAKRRDMGALPKGTLFRANKDEFKKDRLYALTQDTTFNRARVSSMMAVYRADAADTRLPDDLRASGRLFAAPVINSADGLGAELETELRDWHPMQNAVLGSGGNVVQVAMPAAEVGFGLSSHYLFLAEGTRNIQLTFVTNQSLATLDASSLVCKLSGEKGWFEAAVASVSDVSLVPAGQGVRVEVALSPLAPSVTAVDVEVHGPGFAPGVPAMQITLKNQQGEAFAYNELKNLAFSQVELEVRVGTAGATYQGDGTRQLTLATKDGALDPSSAFMPFGALPKAGAAFVLGCSEVFSKKGARFDIDIVWSERPASLSLSPGVTVQFLEGGQWMDAGRTVTEICKSSLQRTFGTMLSIPDGALSGDGGQPASYTVASRAGFMRLILNGDYGHKAYPHKYLDYTIRYNKWIQDGSPEAEEPDEVSVPYVPSVDTISVSYVASTGLVDLVTAGEHSPVSFYHVAPFGTAQQRLPASGSSQFRLLPQFRLPGKPDHVGEWYLGFAGLGPNQSVSVLVQVLEGSTLPLLSKPLEHVTWSYWSKNRWVPFENSQVRDGTAQLVRPGLIDFSIPGDATTDEGVMPHGQLWIRASVTQAVGAVGRILGVYAQAAHLQFEDHDNAPTAQDTPLLPETIKKLKVADATFKKFVQPFPSFGGRPRETDRAFYTRSSERLRHKARAATIWDYEHLVLAAFPQVHRVKCLHHTRVEDNPDASLAIYNENAPGYVTIITLPIVHKGANDTALLKPYTQQSLLSEIRAFLIERISAQLSHPASGPRVCVCNPFFEEIRLGFALQLAPGYSDFTYYSQLLAQEITHFLSPWAFSEGVEAQFGGAVPKSSLVDFIDERPYVHFITDVVMRQRQSNGLLSDDLEVAEATTSRSILVSAAPEHHTIVPYVLGGGA